MIEYTGWLLDAYDHPGDDLVLWLVGEDGVRRRLRQDFPVTFYAAGAQTRLERLERFLESQPTQRSFPLHLEYVERLELFERRSIPVLAICVPRADLQPRLFARAAAAFPKLSFYDADLPVALRHAARYATYPLARCRVLCDSGDRIVAIETETDPWDLEPENVPLRILSIEPNCDPAHAFPEHILIRVRPGKARYRLALEPQRPLLVNLRAILQRHDPDLLLTVWGDTWLIPHLVELGERWGIPLPLNRERGRGVASRPERTYFAYGQVIYRGQQVHLFGRWHVDGNNAMLYHDYGLEGVLEMARVSGLSAQTAGRVSPGSGISAMQIVTALREGVLVPWHKQQAESPRSAAGLFTADQGGLVYQPSIGLHRDVAEIDFVSMYPSIMVNFNVSPETVDTGSETAELVPELDITIDHAQTGLIPKTLKPLLDKRIAIKNALGEMPAWDPRRPAYEARASAHKWLLVTCFGYLGYKNARFGRIEAHQAVTAYGREALLRAKEVAEEMGFEVLHMYVDGLWVRKDGAREREDFFPLLDRVSNCTHLPISLEGVYRWIAFLPSRLDPRVPVANRYFGAFQDGSLKLRGIETRRLDTPVFLVELQKEMLAQMAVRLADQLTDCLPSLLATLRRTLADLRRGRIDLKKMLVSQKLSRDLDEYRVPSPAARAAMQLRDVGKHLRPGQRIRFLYTLGEPGVYAWDLPKPPDPDAVDVGRYITLLIRAGATVLGPLGVSEEELRQRLLAGGVAQLLPIPEVARNTARELHRSVYKTSIISGC
ncbi:MAG: DNA polymerase domain-containing protein [Gammaproteobacteria bacterium]|jgi:DNA polymerase-2